MTLRLSTELRDAIVAHAAEAPGEEACGLLLGRGDTVEAVERCRNVAADRRARFEIDPAALLAAHRRARCGGPAVIGHYHSHPAGRAEPSPRDAEAAAADGAVWLIVAGNDVQAWRALADGPLLGHFVPCAIVG